MINSIEKTIEQSLKGKNFYQNVQFEDILSDEGRPLLEFLIDDTFNKLFISLN